MNDKPTFFCRRCGLEKPIAEKSGGSGLIVWCQACADLIRMTPPAKNVRPR